MSPDNDFRPPDGEPELKVFGLTVQSAQAGGVQLTGTQQAIAYLVCVGYLVCATISIVILVANFNVNGHQLMKQVSFPVAFGGGLIGLVPVLSRRKIRFGPTSGAIATAIAVISTIIAAWLLLGSFNILIHCSQNCEN